MKSTPPPKSQSRSVGQSVSRSVGQSSANIFGKSKQKTRRGAPVCAFAGWYSESILSKSAGAWHFQKRLLPVEKIRLKFGSDSVKTDPFLA